MGKLKILIIGSEGLIGTALCRELTSAGYEITRFDLKACDPPIGGCVCSKKAIRRVIQDVSGIIHLAAVSRVIWGEQNPNLCWETDFNGTRNLVDIIEESGFSKWLIYASSREVYGQADDFPVREDSPYKPINVYAHTKFESEILLMKARKKGLKMAITRLSNVYGSIKDHFDRVISAFARQAVINQPLRVDGGENKFDFTHVEDVIRGLIKVTHFLESDERFLPLVHFVTGNPTSLNDLANHCIELSQSASEIYHSKPRSFDVSNSYGSYDRARNLLDWEPSISLKAGLSTLVRDFQKEVVCESEGALLS